jgi:hypothetical protein
VDYPSTEVTDRELTVAAATCYIGSWLCATVAWVRWRRDRHRDRH